MLKKRAKFRLVDISPLNYPKLDEYVVNQHIKVASNAMSDAQNEINASNKEAEMDRDSDNTVFDLEAEIKKHPSSLYVKCFAIKADEPNDNGDYFGYDELKEATGTFVGVPIFTNHKNDDVNEARGKVIHSWWDDSRNGIMIIARVDSEAYPQLARGIKEEYIVGCFPPDAPVLLADGTEKNICDIEDGDVVISGKGLPRKVLGTRHRAYDHPLLSVKAEGIDQPLVMTAYHNVMVYRLPEICACGCGEALPEIKNTRLTKHAFNRIFKQGHNTRAQKVEHEYVQKIPAHELRINDLLIEPRAYKFGTKTGSIKEREAFLMGLFLAEGSYEKQDGVRHSVIFNFGFSEAETLAEKTAELLENVFVGHRNKPTIQVYPDASQSRVCMSGKDIADWFFTRCGEYSDQKSLSVESAFCQPKEVLASLIAGYIEGDGWNVKKRTYGLTTASPKLASQFRVILSKLGVRARYRTIKREGWGYKPVHEITFGISTAKDIHRRLLYKKADHRMFDSAAWHSLDDIILRRVKSIGEVPYKGVVYDLEIDEDHTYCVNHIAVSNTSMGCTVHHSLCSICHNYAETPDQYCFERNTPILMSDFTVRPISEIKVGDEVIDASGNKTKVTQLFVHKNDGKALLLKSRSICGEMICTHNHPFLTHSRGEYRYIPAEHLSDKATLYTPIPAIEQDNSFFEKFGFCHLNDKQKESLCRLIGYYAAEGSRVKRNGQIKAIELTFHKDEVDYITDVIGIFKSVFGKKPSVYTNQYTKNTTRIRFWDKRASNIYATCPGTVHRERSKHFDGTVFTLSNKFLRQILRGFVDGDGHCDNSKSIVINSACHSLVSQIYYMHLILGMSPSIGLFKNGGGPISRDKEFDCFRIHIGNSQLHQMHNQGVKYASATMVCHDRSKLTKTFTDDDLYCKHSIYAIDDIDFDDDVFNFETESHSYVANNTVVHNCGHIRDRKTRDVSARNQKCHYHDNGSDEECPICGCNKGETKKFNVEKQAFEYNYGIKFIENSFVVNPACHDCGVTEVIDPVKFRAKVAEIEKSLPMLLKAAGVENILCDDKKCYKVAGQEQLDNLNQALELLTSVSMDMLKQKNQIDLEFLTDLTKVLSDLQTVTDELSQQGYGRLPGPEEEAKPGQGLGEPGLASGVEGQPSQMQPVNPTPGGGSKIQEGPAGSVGTVTGPTAQKVINLEKISSDVIGAPKQIKISPQVMRNLFVRIDSIIERAKDKSIHIDFPSPL